MSGARTSLVLPVVAFRVDQGAGCCYRIGAALFFRKIFVGVSLSRLYNKHGNHEQQSSQL